MRKLLIVVMVVGIVAMGWAQGIRVGVQGQGALPVGDWSDFASFGFGGSVFGEYTTPSNLAITAQVGYLVYGSKEDIPGTKIEYSMIPILGGVRYYLGLPEAPTRIFISGQAGITSRKAKAETSFLGSTVSVESTDSEFTFGPGAGVSFGNFEVGAVYYLISDSNFLSFNVAFAFPVGAQ